MTYMPRTQSRKFRDGDCPEQVLAIYDNGGKSFDRYTVYYKPLPGDVYEGKLWISCRYMSEHPSSPQGFGISDQRPAHEVAAYRNRVYRDSAKWSELPEEVKEVVRRDCVEFYERED